MRRMSKSLTGVAKATVSRSKGRAVASSQWYSTVPPPKDEDLEEEEDGKEEEVEKEDEWSLKGKRFIAFPESIGGGFLVDEKKETKKSSGGAFGQGTHRNYDQGTGKPDYGGGCSGCHGCSRCPECNGGCRYRSGGSN
ncbi:unnamed protein product [Arabidopsis arenosa]|uniref:Uncharacterized protein n=1 Tax=Arabidopsis arenosa TaxID=38785 RepID=A0A8S2B0P3_ARAAE|nr:unnamed protein product [Arabidopsis arenosa]